MGCRPILPRCTIVLKDTMDEKHAASSTRREAPLERTARYCTAWGYGFRWFIGAACALLLPEAVPADWHAYIRVPVPAQSRMPHTGPAVASGRSAPRCAVR